MTTKATKAEVLTVIGLVGPKSSGKSVAANMLERSGFVKETLSTRVREAAAARGITEPTLPALQDIGNELREKFGAGVLARLTVEKLSDRNVSKLVIDGIRNPGEIEFFRGITNCRFVLLAIDAPRDLCWKYMSGRARKGDPETYEEFLAIWARDLGEIGNPLGQQVAACMAMADATIRNEGTKSELEAKVREWLMSL